MTKKDEVRSQREMTAFEYQKKKKNHLWNQKVKPNSGLSLVKIYIS